MMKQDIDGSDLEEGELPNSQPAHELGTSFSQSAAAENSSRAPLFVNQTVFHPTQRSRKKKEKRSVRHSPVYHDVYGPQATADIEVKTEEGPVRISDVQNLLLWVLAEGSNPRWCFIKNKPLVKGVVVLALHGLDQTLYQHNKGNLPCLSDYFGEPIELQSRNSTFVPGQTVHALFTVPVNKKRKREETSKTSSPSLPRSKSRPVVADPLLPETDVKTCKGTDVGLHGGMNGHAPKFVSEETAYQASGLPPSHYVLTKDELIANNYPIPSTDDGGNMICPEGYVFTKPSAGPVQNAIVALDCEMCITENGFELTRVTVIGENRQVLLDELVKPIRPIVDYNTRYSGITEAMLQNVTTDLPEIQLKLLEIISAETLIVAHSGENDLRACQLVHANVVDTALLYPHPKGTPYKSALRVLASRHLLRTIQRDSHDPIEDARAALDLAYLKFHRGPSFGVPKSEKGDKLTDVLCQNSRACWMIDSHATLGRHLSGNCHSVQAETDKSVVDGMSAVLKKGSVDFLWGQLLDLHKCYEKRLEQANLDIEAEKLGYSKEYHQEIENVLNEWDRFVKQLWNVAHSGTLFVLVCGQGDTLFTRYIQEQKYQRQQERNGLPAWSQCAEEFLAERNARAISGLCFAAVK